ncbi:hypothetical protein L1887_04998 [Cichorium endivia]|nr:hypothetical protein L1887_04998 [Cichorium endivia]
MRNRGKWVTDIHEPNKHSRIWRVSYSSHVTVVAAGDYNTSNSNLFGLSTCLSFPDSIRDDDASYYLSPASIRKKATKVKANVDILENGERRDRQPSQLAVNRVGNMRSARRARSQKLRFPATRLQMLIANNNGAIDEGIR